MDLMRSLGVREFGKALADTVCVISWECGTFFTFALSRKMIRLFLFNSRSPL
jgi:hypothetical protein